jgi:hypothetical protein
MSRPEEYLAIPGEYGRWLGGLRWSADREAVEYEADEPSIGLTFAMAGEIALFLEGFHAVRKPVAFAYVLHLLRHLFGTGRGSWRPRRGERSWDRLAVLFDAAGRPLRNAGYLCGALCRDVPGSLDPPDLADLGVALRGRFAGDRPSEVGPVAEPSLDPDEFDARVARALARLDDGAIRHWLEHGRGPIGDAGERVAEEAETRPPSLVERLDEAARRPRLAAAGALMPTLDGALTLPARRLAPAALPVGGYSDVATRGHPEQILPGQFALDGLEFLRRFAAHELLYFHREEPRSAEVEELVLVLDQGVRTWGDVRLVLSAAALALGRRAARRGMPLRLATTAGTGDAALAEDLDAPAIGALLEASDLSADPGAALEGVLESRCEGPRDVVLLTHPRSLASGDVPAAARRAGEGTRLFTVAVDASGRVELAEIRRGAPVTLASCRVTIPAPTEPLGPPDVPPAPASGWRGDIEPIGYPFRLGAVHPIREDCFAFDDAGEWLLAAAGPLGLLLAWKLDGSAMEVLPRPTVRGMTMEAIEAILGVPGGFVVAGRRGLDLIAAEYDFRERICRVHQAGGEGNRRRVDWRYLRAQHAVAAWDAADRRCLEVFHLSRKPGAARRQAGPAAPPGALTEEALGTPPGGPLLIWRKSSPADAASYSVRLDPETGAVEARTQAGLSARFTPMLDGKPEFLAAQIVQARSGGSVLALLVAKGRTRSIHLFRAPDGLSLGAMPVGEGESGFALSADGRYVARRLGPRVLHVREVGSAGPPLFVTERARVHSQLSARLGDSCLWMQVGNHHHVLRWDREYLATYYAEDCARALANVTPAVEEPVPGAVLVRLHDSVAGVNPSGRFTGISRVGRLSVVTDSLGHAIVLDERGDTVAIFHVFRHTLAGWLPDGTVFGPPALIGGPPTPAALTKFAAALRRAYAGDSATASAFRREPEQPPDFVRFA